MKSYWTRNRKERQAHRENGKYAKVNPCYRCGKSAGADYCSVNADSSDSIGNNWNDIALCLCEPCATYLQAFTDSDPVGAWAEVNCKQYGQLPQGEDPLLQDDK